MATSHSNPKSPEQIHYENIATFFKWGIGITGSLIALIAAIAIYVTFSDRKAMQDEYKTAIADLKTQMTELKNDAKQSVSDIKSDAKETATTIKSDSKESLKNTQDYADKEISKIKISTNDIATRETIKQIQDIFATNKIQNLIEKEAVKEIQDKVMDVVNTATINVSTINDASVQMRIGNYDGLKNLKVYFENAKSYNDSLMAKKLYDQICIDYWNFIIRDIGNGSFGKISIIDNKMPSLPAERSQLIDFMRKINDTTQNLNSIALNIVLLDRETGLNFKPFQFDEINKWFNGLKK